MNYSVKRLYIGLKSRNSVAPAVEQRQDLITLTTTIQTVPWLIYVEHFKIRPGYLDYTKSEPRL